MKKLIIASALLLSSTAIANSYTVENTRVIDIGVSYNGLYYMTLEDELMPIDCPDGRLWLAMRQTAAEEMYNIALKSYAESTPLPYLKFIQADWGKRCRLREIGEPKEWDISDLHLYSMILDGRFRAENCPDPFRQGKLGYEWRQRLPGQSHWSNTFGGKMFQLRGTTCQSGPFDLLITRGAEIKWRVGDGEGNKTPWTDIIGE